MRMWGVDPGLLCDQHLLGAHVETHMAVGWLRKDRDVTPWADRSFVDTSRLRQEHDALAEEMTRRGMNHESPLPEFRDPGLGRLPGEEDNLLELSRRCPDCADRIRRESAREGPAQDGARTGSGSSTRPGSPRSRESSEESSSTHT